jgi:hypothetical protein
MTSVYEIELRRRFETMSKDEVIKCFFGLVEVAQEQRYAAMPTAELVDCLFEATPASVDTAELDRHRPWSLEHLLEGLGSDDPVENGSCKAILAERMAAEGDEKLSRYIRRRSVRDEFK